MLSQKNRYADLLWWIGVPVVMIFIVFGPHWIWNASHQMYPWWRIPVIGQMMFDLEAYLEWMGSAISGIPYGGHLSWFGWFVRCLAKILPVDASLAELWFVSRWISMVAIIWAAERFFHSRWIALLFWISTFLVLGMRPGVFSWYLPFGILGCIACLKTAQALRRQRIAFSIGWSILGIALTSMYLWFFIYILIWTVSNWAVWIIRRSRNAFWVVIAIASVFASLSWKIAWPYLTSEPALIFFESYTRHGLSFTHLPLISNSFIALILWIILFASVIRHIRNDHHNATMMDLVTGWLTLLPVWLLSVFTGVYIHNDHFRTPVLLLSWVSFSALWLFFRESRSFGSSRCGRLPVLLVFCIAAGFVLKIIFAPFAFNGDLLNVLQLSHWLTLAFGSAMMLAHLQREDVWVIRLKQIFAGCAIAMGIVAAIAVYQREFLRLPSLEARVPAVEWIRAHVPKVEAVCTDPQNATFYAAHTAHRVYLNQESFLLRETHEDAFRRIKTYAKVYDISGSGNISEFEFFLNGALGTACNQYGISSILFRLFGISEQHIARLIGCPVEIMKQNRAFLSSVITNSNSTPEDIQKLCPWILISKNQAINWHLPSGYSEHRITPEISLWNRP